LKKKSKRSYEISRKSKGVNMKTIKEVELEEKLHKYKQVINKIKEYINRTEINSVGTPLAYTEIGKELLELLEEIE
jgi:hypothetical protein